VLDVVPEWDYKDMCGGGTMESLAMAITREEFMDSMPQRMMALVKEGVLNAVILRFALEAAWAHGRAEYGLERLAEMQAEERVVRQ
jgi:hypothetical protein